jgi:hypothetical protein
MRDWALVLTPVIIAIYFLLEPDQFKSFMDRVENLLH